MEMVTYSRLYKALFSCFEYSKCFNGDGDDGHSSCLFLTICGFCMGFVVIFLLKRTFSVVSRYSEEY